MQIADALSLCEEMTTGLAVCAADLRVLWVNPALAGWFDQGPARLCSRHLSDLAPQAPDLLKHARRCIDEARASRLHDVLFGSQANLRMAVVELTPHGAGGLLMEVHEPEVCRTGLTLGLRGLAHELRNPLSGLRGAAQLLERRLREPALRELAVLIREEADRLESLASRLLQPGDTAPPDSFNVHEVLERAAALLGQDTARRLSVERDYDPALPSAFGDPQRIEQIVLNLLQNALQAGAQEVRLRTRVEIGTRLPGGRRALRIEVLDDGPGVAVTLRAHLFEPWVSGRQGSGLGLALSRAIAEEHGGELLYAPEQGVTRFVLRLPQGEA